MKLVLDKAKLLEVKDEPVINDALFRETVKKVNDALNKNNALTSRQFLVKSTAFLAITSDHGMTVQRWLEINYPHVQLSVGANGYAA